MNDLITNNNYQGNTSNKKLHKTSHGIRITNMVLILMQHESYVILHDFVINNKADC